MFRHSLNDIPFHNVTARKQIRKHLLYHLVVPYVDNGMEENKGFVFICNQLSRD
jgi:hypothetical protein